MLEAVRCIRLPATSFSQPSEFFDVVRNPSFRNRLFIVRSVGYALYRGHEPVCLKNN